MSAYSTSQVLAGDATVDLGVTTGPFYTVAGAMFRNGGQYTCQCADGGQECKYNVSGLSRGLYTIDYSIVSSIL